MGTVIRTRFIFKDLQTYRERPYDDINFMTIFWLYNTKNRNVKTK